MVELSPSFELECRQLDDDHRRLVDIVNHIVDALDSGRTQEGGDMVPEFIDLARKHFAHEEAFLRQLGYPEAEAHHESHLQLRAKMDRMLALSKTVSKNKLACESLRKELVFFIMDDVINEDLNFKSFLANKNIMNIVKPE
jgi:hemerythrin